MKNIFRSILFTFALLFLAPMRVQAVTTPTFPACSNPQGTVKATYSEGTHGIPGNTDTYTGSDTVYTLSDETLTQCFCADNGNGTQTNWWKVSSLSEAEIQILRNDGWVYIPNGALWGLHAEPYMAKNSPYACRDNGTGGGDVLASATGNVLGLASTGNMETLVAVGFLAIASFVLSFVLRKRQ